MSHEILNNELDENTKALIQKVEKIVDLDKEALKNSRGVIGFNYCEQIYKLEKELRESYALV